MEGDPNHLLWQRDAHGSNGLITIELSPSLSIDRIEKAVGSLRLFGIGASWGGYESLVLPVDVKRTRFRDADVQPGYLLRLHIGLEDPQDLKRDLSNLLDALSS